MWLTASRPHFLSGGSCWWFLRPGHAGDDITIQELHPDCDWCRRGAALPDGPALWKVHQTCHSGAEGQVDPAHSGVRTHPQEKKRPRLNRTSTFIYSLSLRPWELHPPPPIRHFSSPHPSSPITGMTLPTILLQKVGLISDSPALLLHEAGPLSQRPRPLSPPLLHVLLLFLSFITEHRVLLQFNPALTWCRCRCSITPLYFPSPFLW